jgi:metal-dependent hydrolase (beta-lactamase superfamily II)
MGDKQSEKFFGYYSLWGSHSLDKSLAKYGFSRDDITDVFMTHLHFDHCGGSVQWNKKQDTNLLSKTQNFGLMKTIGNGLQNQIPGRKHHSCPKIFYQCGH